MNSVLSVYTDGGSRGNPGEAAFGVVIKKDGVILHSFGKAIGVATNNVAEYTGILESLKWINDNKELIVRVSEARFYMDSLLACQQLNGIYKIKKAHLAAIMIRIRELERKLTIPIHYNHIPREKNREADKLVNQALDNLR